MTPPASPHLGEPRVTAAPYLSMKGAAVALLVAIVLFWPMLLADGPLYYNDTYYYWERGNKIAAYLSGQPFEIEGAGTNLTANADLRAGMMVRSLPYAVYTYLTGASPLGLYLLCLLQGAAVLWAFFALVPPLDRSHRPALLAGFAFVALGSSLPWFVSYAMPDILGAIPVIYYVCMARRIDELGAWQRFALLMLTIGAITTHYGNVPLSIGLAGAVVAWRAVRGSLTRNALILTIAPVLAALALNMTAGVVATHEASPAPKRLPIMLARSLEDGPARWYLDDVCPEAGYTMCEIFETMPDNISDFLWTNDKFGTASDAQIDGVREEELTILWEAFKRYPAEQTGAIFGNATRQVFTIGTDQLYPLRPEQSAMDLTGLISPDVQVDKPAGFAMFDMVVPWATLAAAILLAGAIITGRVAPIYVEAAAILALALIINAAIFGGLSAPVDRYQGRIAWLIPALLALALATRMRSASPSGTLAAST
jgi:hypothetical protein